MLTVFAALLYLTATCFGCPVTGASNPGDKIAGGDSVAIEDFPYQLGLELNGALYCGATIISSDWAITAAHCIDDYPTNVYTLRANSSTLQQGGSVHAVPSHVIHPNYTSPYYDNDFALLRVDPPFSWNAGVAAIPMPNIGHEFPEDTLAIVSGWGATVGEGGTRPSELQAVQVQVVRTDVCDDAYDPPLTDNQMCAGAVDDAPGVTRGDDGDPLVIYGLLAGIVSAGTPNANWPYSMYPGVYAKVSAARGWIRDVTWV